MYVDDFISRAPTVAGAKKLKQEMTEIFSHVKLDLHKQHWNFPEIEANSGDDKPNFAWQSLGNTLSGRKYRLLRLSWEHEIQAWQSTESLPT